MSIDDCDVLLRDGHSVVWVDIVGGEGETLRRLAAELNLHPLALEDLSHPHQRPKVDHYTDHLLVVLFNARSGERTRMGLEEVGLFAGPRFLVSVHTLPMPQIDALRERVRADPSLLDGAPVPFLVYRIAEALVAGFFPLVDRLDDELGAIEDRLFQCFDPSIVQRVFALRRSLIELRRVLAPQRDVFATMARHETLGGGNVASAYFTDLVDLVLRLAETVDTLRERLSAALESYLTLQSNDLNVTMKRLTALTLMVAVPTLIAGIYGMNFRLMPELDWQLGYAFALGMMVAAALSMLLIFKARDWL